MDAQVFLKWVELTGTRYAADFVKQIGVSRPVAEEYYRLAKEGLDVPIKRSIALAMSAVAQALKPWDEYER